LSCLASKNGVIVRSLNLEEGKTPFQNPLAMKPFRLWRIFTHECGKMLILLIFSNIILSKNLLRGDAWFLHCCRHCIQMDKNGEPQVGI
jgi:hypothetical protein